MKNKLPKLKRGDLLTNSQVLAHIIVDLEKAFVSNDYEKLEDVINILSEKNVLKHEDYTRFFRVIY